MLPGFMDLRGLGSSGGTPRVGKKESQRSKETLPLTSFPVLLELKADFRSRAVPSVTQVHEA